MEKLERHERFLNDLIRQHHDRNIQSSAGRLINHILRDEPGQDSLRAILFDYEEDRQTWREMFEAQETSRKDESRVTIKRWLSDSIDESIDHNRFRKIRDEFPDAGSWILQDPKIKDWMNNETPKSSLLWINGKLGAGMCSNLQSCKMLGLI